MITTLQFTPSPPSLSFVSQFNYTGSSPTWLAQSPKLATTIYSTNETDVGSINSLELDLKSGNLTHIASVPSHGGAPTHLGLIDQGAALGAANFVNGSAFIVNLDSTGAGQFTGNGSLVPFTGSGPLPNQATPHAHQIVQFGNELLVPDLGSDKIWRLAQEGSVWAIKGSIEQPAGSGPRHLVVVDNNVYTVHEMGNTVTQNSIHPLSSGNTSSPLIANVTILPSDLPANASMGAAELLFAPSPTPLLYASNRNLALNPDNPGEGDTITVLSMTPALKAVGHVKTGLAQIRAMAFLGEHNEYILAAGLVGGGIKVYERVSADQGFLKEIASLKDPRITKPTSFVGVEQNGTIPGTSTGKSPAIPTGTAVSTSMTMSMPMSMPMSMSMSMSMPMPTSTTTPKRMKRRMVW